MSIIHEALRKAERERTRQKHPTPFSVENFEERPVLKPRPVEAEPSPKPVETVKIREYGRQQNKSLIITVVALFVAAWGVVFIARALLPTENTAQPVTLPIVSTVSEAKLSSTIEQAALLPTAVIPPKPIAASSPELLAEDFRLTGIFWSGGKWTAIINGRFVEEGDVAVDATVAQIQERKVRIVRGDSELILRMY